MKEIVYIVFVISNGWAKLLFARMNLLFSYLVFYLGKIYVYVFTKIPTLYENLYLCESAEVFLYSEIETKKSF